MLSGLLDHVRAVKLDVELRESWRRRLRGARGSSWVVEEMTRPGDVVLDIGASWGHYTWAMARIVGNAGRVHAFEPNPANTRQLELIALRHRNVTVHRVGLSDTRGTALLHVPTRQGRTVTELGTLADAGSDTEPVAVTLDRLDDVIDVGTSVAFVKCDVEGHERSVFAGGAALVERCRPAILVELERRHAQANVGKTIDWLEAMGYRGYMVLGAELAPAGEFDPDLHQAGEPTGSGYVSDFLFVPAGRTIGRPPNR